MQLQLVYPAFLSLEMKTSITFFFFSLYRLTHTYVMIFIPALPVSFQGLRGSFLEVHW